MADPGFRNGRGINYIDPTEMMSTVERREIGSPNQKTILVLSIAI